MNDLAPTRWGGNLLINGDFNVRQQGSEPFTGMVYGVDGWLGSNAGTTVTPTTEGLALTASSGSASVRQYTDDVQALKGKHVTLSACFDGRIRRVTGLVPTGAFPEGQSAIAGAEFGDDLLQIFTLRSGTSEYLFSVVGAYSSGSASVRYAKLEEGEIATPLVREDPAIALMRCQRRFHRLKGGLIYDQQLLTAALNPKWVWANIDFPVPMRAVPNLSFSRDVRFICEPLGVNVGSDDVTFVHRFAASLDRMEFSFYGTETDFYSASAYAHISIPTGAYIDFNANI